jgi:hypothetical protein
MIELKIAAVVFGIALLLSFLPSEKKEHRRHWLR